MAKAPPPLTKKQEEGRKRASLDTFLSCYHLYPRPEAIPYALEVIRAQGLLRNPQDTFGLCGAIKGLAMRHPDLAESWKERYGALLNEADALYPPDDDAEIVRVGHIDYLFMMFLVGGDLSAIDRVVSIAHRVDEVGKGALNVVVANSHNPRVFEALNSRAPDSARISPILPKEVQEYQDAALLLAEHLNQLPGVGTTILYVGYAPALVKDEAKRWWDHRLCVCTASGERSVGIPKEWMNIPVDVRGASPEELAQSARIRASLQDRP